MTDIVKALTDAARKIGSRTCQTPDCPHCADAALLRELAQRITDYREAHAADQDEPYYDADLRRYRTRSALLTLVCGGEPMTTPTPTEEAPTNG
jgi:hypothetical protein